MDPATRTFRAMAKRRKKSKNQKPSRATKGGAGPAPPDELGLARLRAEAAEQRLLELEDRLSETEGLLEFTNANAISFHAAWPRALPKSRRIPRAG